MTLNHEVEKFFSDVKKVIFRAPTDTSHDMGGSSIMCLVLDIDKLIEYWYADINKKIRDFLYNGRTTLLFTLDNATEDTKISICDLQSHRKISIPNAIVDDSMQHFVQLTQKTDDIFLLTGSIENEINSFNNITQKNLVLILHGYDVV